jgi:hypothetical protein
MPVVYTTNMACQTDPQDYIHATEFWEVTSPGDCAITLNTYSLEHD